MESSTAKKSDHDFDSAESPRPQLKAEQFAISELFWLLAFVGLALAILTPFLRTLPQANFNVIIGIFCFQGIVVVLSMVFATRQRMSLLKRGGKLVAVGSSAKTKSRWRAVTLLISVVMVVQFMGAFCLIWKSSGRGLGPLDILVYFSLSTRIFTSRHFVSFFRWRILASTIEFLENGVAQCGSLTPWYKVELKPSRFENRILICDNASHTGRTIWVDEAQITQLLEFAAAKRHAK